MATPEEPTVPASDPSSVPDVDVVESLKREKDRAIAQAAKEIEAVLRRYGMEIVAQGVTLRFKP